MSFTKKDEEIEEYRSVKDQIGLLKKDLNKLDEAKNWKQVAKSIQNLKERIEYMDDLYGK